MPEGRARGLAVHASFGSIVAQAVEVSADGGTLRVHDIACAIDCGTAVNPLGIEAQVQSAISVGLTATLPVEEMPRIRVRIINSKAKMGGISEAAVAPLAPAIANAVFALAGQRVRTLPLRLP